MKKIFLLPFALIALNSCSSDNNHIAPIEQISAGTVFGTTDNPLAVGGPNEQNQVYVDLSGETATVVSRDSWDLGFYSGTDFRVVINGSLAMAVKALETTDISLTQTEDATVAVGTFDAGNMAYIDNPNGALAQTAFGDIATSEATAKVYLVNLGKKVPTAAPAAGSTNVAGDPRGWKKVKIFKDGNGYKIQYADLASATHTEVAIAKNAAYNFVFFNLGTGTTVNVEPEQDKWDLNFTTFTNEVFQGADSFGAYFYSDFVLTNTKGGVTVATITGNNAAYQSFNLAAITSSLSFATDQRAIGANWRDVFTQTVFDTTFFIVKDADGNLYKLKFISMLDTTGERGYPTFQYALLQ